MFSSRTELRTRRQACFGLLMFLVFAAMPPAVFAGAGAFAESAESAAGEREATAHAAALPWLGPFAAGSWFAENPLLDPGVVLEGDVLARVEWVEDAPAFPGDPPGSLSAVYDATLPPGRIGWALPAAFTEDDTFTAAAVFVLDPEGFHADPFGFFQISWGLWNARTTGMERTGTFENFAADTFELVEFDYFPNVSPFFGGPFLAPSIFGRAVPEDPLFDFLGAFTNFASDFSVAAELPLGVPLLAVMEHRPEQGLLTTRVFEIGADGEVTPVDGAASDLPLAFLAVPEYTVDTVGLTLWHDGFTGPSPSLRARVLYHAVGARPGVAALPGGLPFEPAGDE